MEFLSRIWDACWSAVAAAAVALGLSSPATDGGYQGYVEGEYVLVSPTVGGQLLRLSVVRGDRAVTGGPLFALDSIAETADRDRAAAQMQQANDRLADLGKGRRRPEVEVILAQKAQAQEQLRLAGIELDRQTRLLATGDTAKALFDQTSTAYNQAKSRIDELEAQLRVALQPQGREDELRAAEADVAASEAALAEAQWRLDQKTVAAPAPGLVTNTFFRVGEMVAPGQPVVEILPAANIKVRFYVPQAALARVPVGAKVAVHCDGCAGALPATVRFASPQAEYTPPVLYNRENRDRLVFLIEAWPTENAELLRPGQPVDVTPAP